MPLTTTPVTFELFTPLGDPASGVRVTCTLSSMQVDSGMVVRSTASGTTNSSGVLVLDLWPNTRGDGSSYYAVRHSGSTKHQLKQDEFFIKVPESSGAHVKDIVVDVVPQTQATTPSVAAIAAHINSTDGHLTPQQIAAGAEAAIGVTEGGVILDAQGSPVSIGGDYSDDDAISAVAGAMSSGGGVTITTSAGSITLTVAQATTLVAGIVRLAASAETLDPAITNRAVTPAGLRYVRGGSNGLASLTAAGLINRDELGLGVGDLAAILPTGILVRTSASAVAGRSIAVVGNGLSITDGSALAGNPTLALSATMQAIAGLTPTTGGVPYYTAPGGPADLFTSSSWFRGSWAPLADAAAARTLLGMSGGTLLTGCNADMVDGYHVGSAQTNTSGPFIPLIGTDGIIRVGRYIDFHRALGSGVDADVRLEVSATAGDINVYISGNRVWRDGNVGAGVSVLGGLTPAADRLPYYTSASTAALAVLGGWARTNLLPATSQAGARTALGLATVASSGAYSDLTGTPTSLPASDVYVWAKAATKPTYTSLEVGAAAAAHTTHTDVLNYASTLRGSVTQATSHTTAVTLNALQGRIQMATGTIPANSTVEFQLNNSYITPDAMPIVTRRGTSLPGLIARVAYFTTGYAIIQVANTTGTDMVGAGPALSFTILGVSAS